MTNSLRELLTGAIDYAGMYPPAALSLEEALANWRQYRAGPDAWMLGRFVCPAAKLDDLAASYTAPDDGPISVVAAGNDTMADLQTVLGRVQAGMSVPPFSKGMELIEIRWPTEYANSTNERALRHSLDNIMRSFEGFHPTLFMELAPPDAGQHEGLLKEIFATQIRVLFQYMRESLPTHPPVGLKLRMRGAIADSAPSSSQVAAVICACRDVGVPCNETGVFWKATAGLHHAVARRDAQAGFLDHGFLNLFAAAVLADRQGLPESAVQEILEDEEAAEFRFDDQRLSWRDLSVNCAEIATAREQGLRSFGSCSFEEPREELRTLGLL